MQVLVLERIQIYLNSFEDKRDNFVHIITLIFSVIHELYRHKDIKVHILLDKVEKNVKLFLNIFILVFKFKIM